MLVNRDEAVKVLLGVAVGFGLGAITVTYGNKLRASFRKRSAVLNRDHKKHLNAEELSLLQGGPRVKFHTFRHGSIRDYFRNRPQLKQVFEETCNELASQMQELEQHGVTPIAPDGKVGGNCSALIRDEYGSKVVVSKSGKAAHKRMDVYADFVIIENFDMDSWFCQFYSESDTILPTSDAPLHFAILCGTPEECSWSEFPGVVLHGHAFETEEKAGACGYPISTEETLFSTPEDTNALLELMRKCPYPENKIYVRKGHGFLLLASNTTYSKVVFEKEMKPHLL